MVSPDSVSEHANTHFIFYGFQYPLVIRMNLRFADYVKITGAVKSRSAKIHEMKRVISLIVLLSVSLSAFPQPSFLLKVVDISSQKPVEFPVILTDLKKVLYGDNHGIFTLNRKDILKHVTISCMGYVSDIIDISGVNTDTVVYLEQAIYELPTVMVSNRRRPLIKAATTKGHLNATFSTSSKTVYLSEVHFPSMKECTIKSVTFKFNVDNFYSGFGLRDDVVMRLHIYEKDRITGLPGKSLMKENYVFKVQKKFSNYLRLDSFQKIVRVDQPTIYIGFEYIGLVNQTNIELRPFNIQCLSEETGRLYYKTLNQDKWHFMTGTNLYIKVEYEES